MDIQFKFIIPLQTCMGLAKFGTIHLQVAVTARDEGAIGSPTSSAVVQATAFPPIIIGRGTVVKPIMDTPLATRRTLSRKHP